MEDLREYFPDRRVSSKWGDVGEWEKGIRGAHIDELVAYTGKVAE
jgi:hypothetical protein